MSSDCCLIWVKISEIKSYKDMNYIAKLSAKSNLQCNKTTLDINQTMPRTASLKKHHKIYIDKFNNIVTI